MPSKPHGSFSAAPTDQQSGNDLFPIQVAQDPLIAPPLIRRCARYSQDNAGSASTAHTA
jgi:hypothetical protein